MERIIGGTLEVRARAIVIDSQTAAHIEVFKLAAHLVKLRIKASRFLHGFFDGSNVGHLGADVKMQKLQYEDNGKRIHMDKTLQKLFPDNAEKKEKGVVIREENFYFTSVMKAISSHLASANPK